MKTPENEQGLALVEIAIGLFILGVIAIGVVYIIADIGDWLNQNHEQVEAVLEVTRAYEALIATPVPETPTPMTTPTPTNIELQATITSLVNQIQP